MKKYDIYSTVRPNESLNTGVISENSTHSPSYMLVCIEQTVRYRKLNETLNTIIIVMRMPEL